MPHKRPKIVGWDFSEIGHFVMPPAQADQICIFEQEIRTITQLEDVMGLKIFIGVYALCKAIGAQIFAALLDLFRLVLPCLGVSARFTLIPYAFAGRTFAAVVIP